MNKISKVIQGTVTEDSNVVDHPSPADADTFIDPYVVPKEMGIYIHIKSSLEITVLDIYRFNNCKGLLYYLGFHAHA